MLKILDEAVCISYCDNTLTKGMEVTILFPVIDK